MPGKDPGGIFITMALGIAGSFLATFLDRVLGLYQEGQAAGFIMSLIGAIGLTNPLGCEQRANQEWKLLFSSVLRRTH